MKNKLIIIIVLMIIIILFIIAYFINKRYGLYKKIDITEKTNNLNKDKPNFDYTFKKVIYYKAINSKVDIVEADFIVMNKKTGEKIEMMYIVWFCSKDFCDNNNNKYLIDLTKYQKVLDLWKYTFFIKNLHLWDVDMRFEILNNDKVILSPLRFITFNNIYSFRKIENFFWEKMLWGRNLKDNKEELPIIEINR